MIAFTDKGITDVSKSLDRAKAFRSAVESKGGKVLNQYWALGEVDGCVIFECPDDKTAASLLLQLGKEDNIRTKTLRVFDATEFAGIVSG
jgi:uncharacterized protein with GYD domain